MVDCFEKVPLSDIPNKMCREMISKISQVTLFPFLHDLVVYSRYSDFAWMPTKSQGLFVATMMPCIAHEIAHAIEIPVKRLTLPDWGIKNNRHISMWTDTQLIAALRRELRVRAIEAHIDGPTTNNRYDINHSKVFASELWEVELERRLPFCKFYKREDFIEWGHFTYQTAYRVWNKDRVMTEWASRATIINDWIESDV